MEIPKHTRAEGGDQVLTEKPERKKEKQSKSGGGQIPFSNVVSLTPKWFRQRSVLFFKKHEIICVNFQQLHAKDSL